MIYVNKIALYTAVDSINIEAVKFLLTYKFNINDYYIFIFFSFLEFKFFGFNQIRNLFSIEFDIINFYDISIFIFK